MLFKGKRELLVFLASAIIFVLPFVLPVFDFTFDVETILTIVSIIFTILVGFFIAASTSNYLRMQTLIADLNAGMISMFNLAKLINPSLKEKVAETIDQYIIGTLDYGLLDFSAQAKEDFEKVVSIIDETKPETPNTESLLQNLHSEKTHLYSTHQEMAMVAKTIVGPRHWMILFCLSSLITILTLTLRDGSFLTNLIVAILLTAIFQVLRLLYEIDANIFLADSLAFDDPQQVFLAIGRLPYYPKYAVDSGAIRNKKKIYRVGVYVDFPKSYKKRIEIVGDEPK